MNSRMVEGYRGAFSKTYRSTDRDQEVTPAPAPVSDPQDTDSESTNQGNNQGTETLLQQRQETEYATPLFDIGKPRERSVSWSPQ